MDIGDLVRYGNDKDYGLGIVVEVSSLRSGHYLVQFEIMKVWLRFCSLEVIK